MKNSRPYHFIIISGTRTILFFSEKLLLDNVESLRLLRVLQLFSINPMWVWEAGRGEINVIFFHINPCGIFKALRVFFYMWNKYGVLCSFFLLLLWRWWSCCMSQAFWSPCHCSWMRFVKKNFHYSLFFFLNAF